MFQVTIGENSMSYYTLNAVKDTLEVMVGEMEPDFTILQTLVDVLYAVDDSRDWYLINQRMAAINTTNIEYANFLFDRDNTQLLVLGYPRC